MRAFPNVHSNSYPSIADARGDACSGRSICELPAGLLLQLTSCRRPSPSPPVGTECGSSSGLRRSSSWPHHADPRARHFNGFQFVSEWSSRRRCWCGSVDTPQRHVAWPTSVCRRRLRTVVASIALQSPEPSWCPGLGRPLASADLACMVPEHGTAALRSPDERSAHSRRTCSSTRPVPAAAAAAVGVVVRRRPQLSGPNSIQQLARSTDRDSIAPVALAAKQQQQQQQQPGCGAARSPIAPIIAWRYRTVLGNWLKSSCSTEIIFQLKLYSQILNNSNVFKNYLTTWKNTNSTISSTL